MPQVARHFRMFFSENIMVIGRYGRVSKFWGHIGAKLGAYIWGKLILMVPEHFSNQN